MRYLAIVLLFMSSVAFAGERHRPPVVTPPPPVVTPPVVTPPVTPPDTTVSPVMEGGSNNRTRNIAMGLFITGAIICIINDCWNSEDKVAFTGKQSVPE